MTVSDANSAYGGRGSSLAAVELGVRASWRSRVVRGLAIALALAVAVANCAVDRAAAERSAGVSAGPCQPFKKKVKKLKKRIRKAESSSKRNKLRPKLAKAKIRLAECEGESEGSDEGFDPGFDPGGLDPGPGDGGGVVDPSVDACPTTAGTTVNCPIGAGPRVFGDFNKDGYDDLAVGSAGEDVNGANSAGAVLIRLGGPAGFDLNQGVMYTQGSQAANLKGGGDAEEGDQLGAALVAGDFNGDQYADLAIGAPGEEVGGFAQAGLVNVIYGGAGGLDPSRSFGYYQGGGLPGGTETDDFVGSALAAGDFDNDGRADLVIGAPGEDTTAADAGRVNVIFGRVSDGLDETRSLALEQGDELSGPAETGDFLGSSVEVGDFNDDGFADLAAGAPGEDIQSASADEAGVVNVILGKQTTGFDLTKSAVYYQGAGGLGGAIEDNDRVGTALAAGDFDGDGLDDLLVGAPGEDVGAVNAAGAVTAILGGGAGGLLDTAHSFLYFQGSGLSDTAEANDLVGAALAVGDFNGAGNEDLAIGAPGETLGATINAGAVNVALVAGSTDAPQLTNPTTLSQVTGGGLLGSDAQAGDIVGASLAVGNFNNDSYDDLAVGAPGDNVGEVRDAGVVNVVFGILTGLGGPSDAYSQGDGLAGTAAAHEFVGGGVGRGLLFSIRP